MKWIGEIDRLLLRSKWVFWSPLSLGLNGDFFSKSWQTPFYLIEMNRRNRPSPFNLKWIFWTVFFIWMKIFLRKIEHLLFVWLKWKGEINHLLFVWMKWIGEIDISFYARKKSLYTIFFEFEPNFFYRKVTDSFLFDWNEKERLIVSFLFEWNEQVRLTVSFNAQYEFLDHLFFEFKLILLPQKVDWLPHCWLKLKGKIKCLLFVWMKWIGKIDRLLLCSNEIFDDHNGVIYFNKILTISMKRRD